MSWYRKWRLRRAQEKFAYWKAKKESIERLGEFHMVVEASLYRESCGQVGKYEERVETLIREQ